MKTENNRRQVMVRRVYRNSNYYVESPGREVLIVCSKLNPAEHVFRAISMLNMAGFRQELERQREEAERRIDAMLADAERMKNDPDCDGESLMQFLNEISIARMELSATETYSQNAADEVHWAPQCMFGMLLLISVLGIEAFRKKDLI